MKFLEDYNSEEAMKMAATKTTTKAADGTSVSINLNKQALEILKKAQERGVEHSYMFITTFKRYQELINHLIALEDAINNEGTMVTKEYVKGRGNLYVNPAVAAYNQTATAADRTAQLLLRYIVAPLSDSDEKDAFDMF